MTDKKFTDDDVIKALEICAKLDFSLNECKECPYKGECGTKDGNMPADALALINRQKAEITRLITSNSQLEARVCADRTAIERLQGAVQEWVDGKCLSQKHLLMIGKLQNEIETAKAEAIKEFAENLTQDIKNHRLEMNLNGLKGTHRTDEMTYETIIEYIDTLVKEMTEENK